MREQVFGHGTPHEEAGRNILEHGIQPGNQGRSARGQLRPVIGRTYLSPSLKHVLMYCIGGNDDMFGCTKESAQWLANKQICGKAPSRYGWLFVILRETLVHDIQPDEDSVGQAALYADLILRNKEEIYPFYDPFFHGLLKADRSWLTRFHHNAKSSMTPRQWKNSMMFGAVSAQSAGGKRFLKCMTNEDKQTLIEAGAHVAYLGPIIPDQAWRFDKLKSCDLTTDGFNFFALAERVR